MSHLKTNLLGLGAVAFALAACAPLPPCPRNPDNPVLVASSDQPSPKAADDGTVLEAGSAEKAKDIDHGPDSGASARVREGANQKELTQEAKVHSEEPKKPIPPACREEPRISPLIAQ